MAQRETAGIHDLIPQKSPIFFHTASGGMEDFTVTLDSSAKADVAETMNAVVATTGNMNRSTVFSPFRAGILLMRAACQANSALVCSVGEECIQLGIEQI
jgi:hypothetical protein